MNYYEIQKFSGTKKSYKVSLEPNICFSIGASAFSMEVYSKPSMDLSLKIFHRKLVGTTLKGPHVTFFSPDDLLLFSFSLADL